MTVFATIPEVIEVCRCLYKPLGLLLLGLVLQTNIIPQWRLKYPLVMSIFYVSIPNMSSTYRYNTLPAYLLGLGTVWINLLSIGFLIPDKSRYQTKIRLEKTEGYPVYEVEKYENTPLKSVVPRALRLLGNVTGIGWNHSARNIYRTKTGELCDPEFLITGKEPYVARAKDMRSQFLGKCIWMILADSIIVDLVVYLALRDDLVSGDVSSNPFLLPLSESLVWFKMLPYRVFIAGMAIYAAMDLASQIPRLVSVGLFGGEYWDNPPVFGSFLSIWDRGLAGFWGTFWHQWFRNTLLSVATILVPEEKTKDGKPSKLRTILRLTAVFACSGLMHAGGSWTLSASMPTPLLPGPHPVLIFFAFLLQAPGIALQTYLFPRYKPAYGNETVYKLKQLSFMMAWGLLTMPLLVVDLAGGQFFKLASGLRSVSAVERLISCF